MTLKRKAVPKRIVNDPRNKALKAHVTKALAFNEALSRLSICTVGEQNSLVRRADALDRVEGVSNGQGRWKRRTVQAIVNAAKRSDFLAKV